MSVMSWQRDWNCGHPGSKVLGQSGPLYLAAGWFAGHGTRHVGKCGFSNPRLLLVGSSTVQGGYLSFVFRRWSAARFSCVLFSFFRGICWRRCGFVRGVLPAPGWWSGRCLVWRISWFLGHATYIKVLEEISEIYNVIWNSGMSGFLFFSVLKSIIKYLQRRNSNYWHMESSRQMLPQIFKRTWTEINDVHCLGFGQYLGLKMKASFGTVATWPSPVLAFNHRDASGPHDMSEQMHWHTGIPEDSLILCIL